MKNMYCLLLLLYACNNSKQGSYTPLQRLAEKLTRVALDILLIPTHPEAYQSAMAGTKKRNLENPPGTPLTWVH